MLYIDDVSIHLDGLIDMLDNIFESYKPIIYVEDLKKDSDDDDSDDGDSISSKIRVHKFIIKLLIKECKSIILNKNSCLTNVDISKQIIDKILKNKKNIKNILNINENKITIYDYITIACMIDYEKYNVYYDIFKLAIRKEKINTINNE